LVNAEKDPGNFGAPAADKAAEAKDFSGPQVKRDSLEGITTG
jgi:hypothetical protein